MTYTFDQLLRSPEDLRGPLVESTTQIQRTMVVGLGGTGGEIIKRLKRRLARHGEANTYIRFLSLDTDVRTWLGTPQFPPLEPRERVPLSYPNPENVLEAPHLYPTIAHLFGQGKKVDISILADANGAGLMPVVGRTAFHLNAGQIYAHLQRGLRDLQAIPSQLGGQPLTEEFRIYLVGSVAGGTGAGCFLETAVLIRHVFRSFKCQLIGLLALPEAFAPTLRGQLLDAQSRGNAYAVLKELQYLQDGPAYWEDPDTHTFQFNLGSDVRTLTLAERPFQILYVIDNQNQDGGALRNLTDIYEMAAQQLSIEIGSPLGAKFASAQANDRAIKGLAPCPETQRPANISSLATAALTIPTERLIRYCTRRYLIDAVRQHLLGEEVPGPESAQRATAWLRSAGLEEPTARMVSRSLMQAYRTQGEVTGAEFAIPVEEMLHHSVAQFTASLAAHEDHFVSEGIGSLGAHLQRRADRCKVETRGLLVQWLEAAVREGGVHLAMCDAQGVVAEIDTMKADLAARQREDQLGRSDLASRLAEHQQSLEAKRGMLGGLFGQRKELMRAAGRLQADLMQLEIDLIARAKAIHVLDAVRAQAEQVRRELKWLASNLVRLVQSTDLELAHQRLGEAQGQRYALETDLLRAEHYPRFYERFRPTNDAFLQAVGKEGLLADLAHQEYSQLAARLLQVARGLFVAPIGQLGVVEVLQELYTQEEAFALLDDLARRCQPFWTATPRGAGAFSDVFLIGSPGVRSDGPEGPVQAEPLLQDWVEQHGGSSGGALKSTPTYVALGSSSSLIFSRQTHGARLHYMRQVLDYQEHYRALQQQRGYPMHFKPCLEALPELRPDDERATECWALGLAYGIVAAKTFGWVWALDTEPRTDGEPSGLRTVLRSGSLWDVAVEIAPVVPQEIASHSSRFLHPTRSGALAQVAVRKEALAAIERLVNRRLDSIGKQVVAQELTRYLDQVLMPRLLRQEEMEAATITKECSALRRFLERLNL
jgi:hypothetical protein